MDYDSSIYEAWPFILKMNFIFSIFFISVSIMLLGTIYYHRVSKNKRAHRKVALELILMDFINSFLFDSDFVKESAILNFKKNHLGTEYDVKIAIKQILMFDENFKGESTSIIKHLFTDLGLQDYVFSELHSNSWHRKARALYVLSQLSVEIPETLIVSLINDKKVEVRRQAMLHFLNLTDSKPLEFLNKIDTPLTLWQQIYVENSLKNGYKGDVPDFSKYCDHDMSSVVAFCVRMMSEFNQFDNIPVLSKMIDHKDEEVRKEAIRSLCKMGYGDLVPLVVSKFYSETVVVKHEILDAIKSNGSYKDLGDLRLGIYQENNSIKIKYYNLELYFRANLSVGNDEFSVPPEIPIFSV